jgi:hypothetical protein
MTDTETKTYCVGVIERAIAYYKVEAGNARTAAENWQDGEFKDRDDEALESEGPCNVRERQPDGAWRTVPPSEWEDEPDASPQLLAACRLVVERWERGDLAEAARACSAAIAEAEKAAAITLGDLAKKPYSVLLLYPDYANDSDRETYYAFVEAPDAIEAVAVAKRDAVAAQGEDMEYEPDEFAALLVIAGHHFDQHMANH